METATKRETFWMVWREHSTSIRYRHTTKASAVQEATRLAEGCPGEPFFVLKATAGVMAEKPPVRSIKLRNSLDSEIPFAPEWRG